MTLRRDMELELPLFGDQILMCWSCVWHFRRRLILISGLRLAQNEILNTFLCIELLRNLATTYARSCFLSILCWVAIVQVRLGVEEDKKVFQLLRRRSTEKYMEIGLLGDSLKLDDKVIDCCVRHLSVGLSAKF